MLVIATQQTTARPQTCLDTSPATMGNALPMTPPPKPSSSRAVLFLESECVRSYLRAPWRRPPPTLQLVGSTDGLPPALDGAVPAEDYRAMTRALAERAARFRGAW